MQTKLSPRSLTKHNTTQKNGKNIAEFVCLLLNSAMINSKSLMTHQTESNSEKGR